MNILKYKFTPIIILLSGPPAFRKLSDSSNILTPSIDIWIAIQIISYIFALYLMITNNIKRSEYHNKNIIDFLIFLNLISLTVSCFLSNNFIISFGYTFLYFIGIFYYYYCQNLFSDIDEEKIINVYILIRNIFFVLSVIVLIFSIFGTDYTMTSGGKRMSGGRIAPALFIGPINFLICIYIMFTKYNNFFNKLCLATSIIFLYFAYARSVWWSTLFLTFLLSIKIFFFMKEKERIIKLRTLFYFLLIFIFIFGSIYFSEIFITLTRNEENPLSLSGRDVIARWVFDYMSGNFFGSGLGTGFQRIFPSLIGLFDHLGLNAQYIGTAHNAFLGIFIAGGWISFVAYILIFFLPIIYFITNINKIIHSNFYLLFLLFIFLFIANLVDASSIRPSYTVFGFSWLTLSLINLYIYKNKKN